MRRLTALLVLRLDIGFGKDIFLHLHCQKSPCDCNKNTAFRTCCQHNERFILIFIRIKQSFRGNFRTIFASDAMLANDQF